MNEVLKYFLLEKKNIDKKYNRKYKKIFEKIILLRKNFPLELNKIIEKNEKEKLDNELEELLKNI